MSNRRNRVNKVSAIGILARTRRIPAPVDPDERAKALDDFGVFLALAQAVINARMSRQWSQQVLARKLGVQQSRISDLESGKGNPSMETIQRLVSVLGIEVVFRPRQVHEDRAAQNSTLKSAN